MRKGISPILASVLLFAVTVSVVGIFANFAPNLVTSLTQETGQQAENQIQCEGAGLAFEGVSHDGTDATYVLRNTGDEDLLNVSVVSFNSDREIIEQTEDINAYAGNLTEVKQTDIAPPESVRAFSGQCGSIELREDL
jgi:archaeal flagellin N-terminal-like domain|nr:MAG: archaeal flagellin N-terminal-like domain protein [Candidatus Nanosalinarum sp. J07AB56]